MHAEPPFIFSSNGLQTAQGHPRHNRATRKRQTMGNRRAEELRSRVSTFIDKIVFYSIKNLAKLQACLQWDPDHIGATTCRKQHWTLASCWRHLQDFQNITFVSGYMVPDTLREEKLNVRKDAGMNCYDVNERTAVLCFQGSHVRLGGILWISTAKRLSKFWNTGYSPCGWTT